MITFRHTETGDAYTAVMLVDKVVRLSKTPDGETTCIHLVTGEIIEAEESIKTLQARIESATE